MKEIRIKTTDISPISDIQIKKPTDCIHFMNKLIGDLAHEYTVVVYLNTLNQPINYMFTSIGDINTAKFEPQKILQAALLQNTAKIMLFHNHPSGNLKPSQPDINATRRIIVAASLFGIDVLDHVIVSKDDFFSFGSHDMLWMSHEEYDEELEELEAQVHNEYRKKKEAKMKL